MNAKKLVIADDSPLVLEMLRDMFEEEGIEVFTIPSAIGLSGLLRRVKPDAVILDLNMPAIRGDEAVDAVRRVCPWAALVFFSDDPKCADIGHKRGVPWIGKHESARLAQVILHALGGK